MNVSANEAEPPDGATTTTGPSAWGPFRSKDFARMASAQFVSNVGSWGASRFWRRYAPAHVMSP